MDSGGTSMQASAMAAMIEKVRRMAFTRPSPGTKPAQTTGATYAMAVPATHVNEMAVEIVSCCLES